MAKKIEKKGKIGGSSSKFLYVGIGASAGGLDPEKNLMDIYAPPSALINDLGEILYIHGRLGKYLELSPGRAHMNILEMAKEGIKLVLSSVIQNAVQIIKKWYLKV